MLQTVAWRHYRRKVKTVDELCAAIGPRPRAQEGHRCATACSTSCIPATSAICSTPRRRPISWSRASPPMRTSPRRNYRPFVPQDLRALNLAALEMVDYVIIDPNPTPLDNIARIQPDYFAKGYEYAEAGINPKTQQELEILQSLRRRNPVHAGRHRLLVVAPDRDRAAEHCAREAPASDGGRGPRLRSLATDHRELRGQAGSCRRRYHRRQPDLHDHDRRHDQDADPERALRQPHGFHRRCRDRRQASARRRSRCHLFDRAGRRST